MLGSEVVSLFFFFKSVLLRVQLLIVTLASTVITYVNFWTLNIEVWTLVIYLFDEHRAGPEINLNHKNCGDVTTSVCSCYLVESKSSQNAFASLQYLPAALSLLHHS